MSRRRIRVPRRRAYIVALGIIAMALGGLVLARAPGRALRPAPDPGSWAPNPGPGVLTLSGPSLSGQLAFDHGGLLAGRPQTLSAELRLEGLGEISSRGPVALAIVLDTSGSMAGEKIEQARSAVVQMVRRMRADDQVALITYDSGARELQALGPASHLQEQLWRVREIRAGGGTNIPAGLRLGSLALSAAPTHLVRRLVLVSDGIDGSGVPLQATQMELRARAAEGTTVSALGIGIDYSEPYLTTVADAGSGNYAFLARGAELEGFLRQELDEAASTVIDRLMATVSLPAGWQLDRAFGAQVQTRGNAIDIPVGALIAGRSRSVILRLRVPASGAGMSAPLSASVRYRTVGDAEEHAIEAGGLQLAFLEDPAAVEDTLNAPVFAQTEGALIDARQAEALEAWRRGDQARAGALSQTNVQALRDLHAVAPTGGVRSQLEAAEEEATNIQEMPAASPAAESYRRASGTSRRVRALY
ncbi:MAG: VWA domain-containing protein [Myxococcales bacterium]|nr:VWA domain-containing protein [Myxococcales bacterium]